MAIPLPLLMAVKELLRIPDPITTFNARIDNAYIQALNELTRESDLFATVQLIDAVAGQSLYTAAPGTTRILAVQHNQTQLMLVPSRSLDLLTAWGTDDPGEPEIWCQDKLPGAGPLQFAIHPRPLVDATGLAGLVLYRIGLPANDTPPVWMFPYFIYRSAALFSDADTEDRDHDAAQIWDGVASVWKELLM